MYSSVTFFFFNFLASLELTIYLISYTGELKSSSPSESPLMEKRDSPILKPVPEESSAMPSITPSAPPFSEERRVTFDIGDSDDGDQKDCKESEMGSGESVGPHMPCQS